MMISRSELDKAKVYDVSAWGHWPTLKEAMNNRYTARQSCLDGYFYNIDSAMAYKDESYAMFELSKGCWDYRRPYVQEIVGMFEPFFGEVMIHDHSTRGPRVVYRLQRGMAKEPIHAFNVFLRYSWGFLNQWPVQEEPPDAKTVWKAHLDYNQWDSSEPLNYITHSNFSAPSAVSRAIGFNSEIYVNSMYEIMSRGMTGFPYDSYSKIPNSGSVVMKRYVFKMAVKEYAASIKEQLKDYDPFDEY